MDIWIRKKRLDRYLKQQKTCPCSPWSSAIPLVRHLLNNLNGIVHCVSKNWSLNSDGLSYDHILSHKSQFGIPHFWSFQPAKSMFLLIQIIGISKIQMFVWQLHGCLPQFGNWKTRVFNRSSRVRVHSQHLQWIRRPPRLLSAGRGLNGKWW